RGGAGEDLARGGEGVHGPRGDPAPVALVADDAEIAELETRALADEHVHRREVPVEHLAAVQLAEDLEDAGDLSPRGGLPPPLGTAVEVRAQVAVARVLEGEAVEDAALRSHQRERVEDADRPGMPVQQLAEVRLAQPAVDALAGLDADGGGHHPRCPETPGEIHLA